MVYFYKIKLYKGIILVLLSIFICEDIMAMEKKIILNGIIKVFSYTDENDVNNLDEVYVADVMVSSDGTISEKPFEKNEQMTKLRTKLRKALSEINSKKILRLKTSTLKNIDGEEVSVLTREDIYPGDSRYIWAVSDFLKSEYDFNCEVMEMGNGK